MTRYTGLTWDHPRGRSALEAASRLSTDGDFELRWDVHTLEGFESAPLAELADRYDLIVLDHPHLGDALASGCLRPMEEVVGLAVVDDIARRAVGPSLETYRLGGSTWALPLDAATQVSAWRQELASDDPRTWEQVTRLAGEAPVALSLAGPHAYLTFASVCQSLGAPLSDGVASEIVDGETARHALELLTDLAAHAPRGSDQQNPIALLERMTSTDDIAFIPLIYGYVGYADRRLERHVTFGPAPAGPDGLIGSTIGGTGIAVTRRAEVTDALRAHIVWLLSEDAQTAFIPDHEGQPAMAAAWEGDAVNVPVGDFYRRTRSTIDAAWTRPRFAGFTPLQSEMSAVIRHALRERRSGADVVATLTRMQNHAASRAAREEVPS
ncbi:MAG: extracellular solute-binding protein [Microbacterium sp.]